MKKKIILIYFLLFMTITGQSQVLISLLFGDKLNSDAVKFGLVGGVNWTTISGLETKDYSFQWNLGYYFDIRIKNQFNLTTGLLVKSNFGVSNLTENDLGKIGAALIVNEVGQGVDGVYSVTINSFILPIMARYNFKNYLYAEAGTQLGLLYRSRVDFEATPSNGIEYYIRQYNSDNLNKISAGLMAGLGYRLKKGKGIALSVRYYYGLVNMFKGVPDTRNKVIYLGIELPIGVEKKENQRANND